MHMGTRGGGGRRWSRENGLLAGVSALWRWARLVMCVLCDPDGFVPRLERGWEPGPEGTALGVTREPWSVAVSTGVKLLLIRPLFLEARTFAGRHRVGPASVGGVRGGGGVSAVRRHRCVQAGRQGVCAVQGQGSRATASTVTTWSTGMPQLIRLRDRLVAEAVQRVVVEATGDYWRPVFMCWPRGWMWCWSRPRR